MTSMGSLRKFFKMLAGKITAMALPYSRHTHILCRIRLTTIVETICIKATFLIVGFFL